MNSVLVDRFMPMENKLVRNVLLALIGSFVVAVAAQVSVPMLPVPMTLQTLAVLSIGAAFGARLGAATLALYALEGAVGLPVFAGLKSGLSGMSVGYVFGFILAAGLVGYLAEKGWDRNIFKMFAAALIGAVVLYVPGLLWLHQFSSGWDQTLAWGLTPFIVGDLVKAALAALGFQGIWALLGKTR